MKMDLCQQLEGKGEQAVLAEEKKELEEVGGEGWKKKALLRDGVYN